MATTLTRPSVETRETPQRTVRDPAFQAFWLLRIGFTVAPILFGADKFAHVLVNWDKYLAPRIVDHLPWTAHQAMYAVGAIEIVAGLIVALCHDSAATWWPPGWPGSSSTCCSSRATTTSPSGTSVSCWAR